MASPYIGNLAGLPAHLQDIILAAVPKDEGFFQSNGYYSPATLSHLHGLKGTNTHTQAAYDRYLADNHVLVTIYAESCTDLYKHQAHLINDFDKCFGKDMGGAYRRLKRLSLQHKMSCININLACHAHQNECTAIKKTKSNPEQNMYTLKRIFLADKTTMFMAGHVIQDFMYSGLEDLDIAVLTTNGFGRKLVESFKHALATRDRDSGKEFSGAILDDFKHQKEQLESLNTDLLSPSIKINTWMARHADLLLSATQQDNIEPDVLRQLSEVTTIWLDQIASLHNLLTSNIKSALKKNDWRTLHWCFSHSEAAVLDGLCPVPIFLTTELVPLLLPRLQGTDNFELYLNMLQKAVRLAEEWSGFYGHVARMARYGFGLGDMVHDMESAEHWIEKASDTSVYAMKLRWHLEVELEEKDYQSEAIRKGHQ